MAGTREPGTFQQIKATAKQDIVFNLFQKLQKLHEISNALRLFIFISKTAAGRIRWLTHPSFCLGAAGGDENCLPLRNQ